MAQPEDRAALQHQRATPKGLLSVMQQVQLHLAVEAGHHAITVHLRRHRQHDHVRHSKHNQSDVVLGQDLGLGKRLVERLQRVDVAQVTRPKRSRLISCSTSDPFHAIVND